MSTGLIGSVRRIATAGCLCCALLTPAMGLGQDGAGFEVERADTRLLDGVYLVNASMMLELSAVAADALINGVPLFLDIDMRVTRERNWWADEVLAEVSQRYRLEYFGLSQQYLVVNLNTEVRELFHDAATALAYIGLLVDFPLLDRVLVADQGRYFGEIRVRLDLGRLPLPLLPNAYFSNDWNLASRWYPWRLK